MKMLLFFLFSFSISKLTIANYTMYKVAAFNSIERSILYNIHLKNRDVYFTSEVTNEAIVPMNVIVKNNYRQAFEEKLYANNIQFGYVSRDLLENINHEYSSTVSINNNGFYDWNAINRWVSKYVKEYTSLKKIVIAKTFENRDLFILKLSTGKKKIAVFIMGGESGMDWLTPAIILNLVKSLLEKRGPELLTDYYNFYFLPFMNPDGYIYSKTRDRFWAKNRKKFIPEIMCLDNYTAEGVNLNRNWHFVRSSYNVLDQECNAVYIGHGPLSEEETQALSYVLNNLALSLVAFINLKGFNRLITIPYGNEEMSINHDVLMELMTMASVKLNEKYNVTYYVGKTAKYIYNSSGNVADWVKKMLNTPVVYTVYMTNKDNILPKYDDVEPLTQQLETILNETLLMAKDIYEPLFSKVCKIKIHFLSAVIISTLCFYNLLCCWILC